MEEHILHYVVNMKVLNQNILDFGFVKVATFGFDDSFAHSSLSQIHEVVTWNRPQLERFSAQTAFWEY